jgi:hypothetical protein
MRGGGMARRRALGGVNASGQWRAPDGRDWRMLGPAAQPAGLWKNAVSVAEFDRGLLPAFNPHGSGPDWPVRVGETWRLEYVFACGTSTPVTYSQTGEVVDVETITVPAGTFSALKLQSALTWTDVAGTTRTETVTNWRDIFTSYSVKMEISIAVSGTAPATGYAVSRTEVLDSIG